MLAPSTRIQIKDKMMKKTFQVNGMRCPHCKAHVEAAIKALPGVSNAEASVENKQVTVDFDEALLGEQDIQKAVNDMGRYELLL